MNIKNTFKKLILLHLGVFFLMLISVFYESEEVIRFNEAMDDISNTLLIVGSILMLIYFINLYFLYNFKKNGKQMFLVLFILGVVLSLFSGPSASDPILYILDAFSWCTEAAILVFLYFTPIKKYFK